MRVARTVWLILAVGLPWPLAAQERVIGLLALPDVFGNGACDRFTPAEIPLYARSDSAARVGAIRVAENWTFDPAGGCEGLMVEVRQPGKAAHPLPTEEYGYEEPGAIVLERSDGWFRIRLADGAGWVRASGATEFFPLERLYQDRLTYLTPDWDGRLSATPGDRSRTARKPASDPPMVRVLESRWHGARQWFLVEMLSHSGCEAGAEPTAIDRGWVPAHGAGGKRSIWFYSRGC